MAKFPLGHIGATPGAIDAVLSAGPEGSSPLKVLSPFLSRHAAGDWGIVDAEDAAANDHALETGARILSVYPIDQQNPSAGKLWIITEADRSSTTILLPEEY